jgi:translocation and assembly module TamA
VLPKLALPVAARTAFPVARTNTAWRIDRLLAGALAALLIAHPAQAQHRRTDPALEELIPDSAIDQPEDWANQGVPPQEQAPGEALDSTSPLADDAEFTVDWPEDSFELPPVASLEPDPDLAEAFAADLAETPPAAPEGDALRVSKRLTLVFPPDPAAFPEREEFEERFKQLSAIENLKGEGDDSFAQLAVRARSDRELLNRLLRIYGYYAADVTQSVSAIDPGSEEAKDAHPSGKVRFDITPGTRYSVGNIDLGNLADAGSEAPMLRRSFRLQTGDPLNSDTIIEEQGHLDTALGENGYAFAEVGDPELLIDHHRDEGDLTMPVSPKGQYVFGEITSNRPRFMSPSHLADIARFDEGDLYQRSMADDLRRALLATGIVSSVTVIPRETKAPQDGQPGVAAIDVAMTKAPLRTIAGALGYETGEGPRAELSWEHRNLFPPEGMLRVRGIAGTKEQLAGVTASRNNFMGRDQVLSLDFTADNVMRDAFEARSLSLTANFEKQTTLLFQKPWVWSAGLAFAVSDEREGDVQGVTAPRRTFKIVSVPLRAAYDGSDNLLDPTRGFRASLRVSPEQSWQSSGNASYARIQFDGSYYQPFGSKLVMAGRVRLGSIPGAPIENIAPSRRFYAGGGGSVRGFGYQEIGPRDSVGDPSGGRALTELSMEARIRTGLFDGAMSVVPFIDGGAVDVGATPRWDDFRIGVGIGVRYATSFGPIRIDVATPLDRRKGESVIGIYVALGQAF